MSRKDYQLIAAALATANEQAESWPQTVGVRAAAIAIARALVATNPRFDESRFLQATGIAI